MSGDEDNRQEPQWSKMTLRAKINYVLKNVTVEPMMACYIIPSTLVVLTNQNLSLEKACRVNLRYSAQVCDALTARMVSNMTTEETEVQKLVAGITGWKSLVQSIMPSLLIMFIGSWSDRKQKRRPFMLLPIIGELLSSLSLIVCTFFFNELPMEVNVILECLFPAITGGWMTMNMAVFSYLGDITTLENRTLRIGILNVCALGAYPIGMALSGILFKAVGFYGVFIIASITYVFGIMFGMLLVKDVKEVHRSVRNSINLGNDLQEINEHINIDSSDSKDVKKKSNLLSRVTFFVKDFFDVQHIKETFSVMLSGTKRQRTMKLLLIFVFIAVTGQWNGELAVMYFFMRLKFHWNEVQFSLFTTYSIVLNLFGTTISVGLFSHLLKIDDALIGIMSGTSKTLAGCIYAFAQTDWQVYLAPLVDIVNGTSYIAMRSIASKLVPPEELGKLYSVYGACESITPLLYGPMYAWFYAHTLNTFPGAFFLLGGVFALPVMFIFGWMYTQNSTYQQQTTGFCMSSQTDVTK